MFTCELCYVLVVLLPGARQYLDLCWLCPGAQFSLNVLVCCALQENQCLEETNKLLQQCMRTRLGC